MEAENKVPVQQEAENTVYVENTADASAENAQPATLWEKWKKRQAEKKEKQKQRTLKQEIWSWVYTLLAAVVIAMLIRMFIGEAIRVDGNSMTNTLQNGEIVLVSKTAYLFGDVERNDIVICHYPHREKWQLSFGATLSLTKYELFVKRVVALPGDTVQITGGKLYVNGELVPDPEYMGSAPLSSYGPLTLGENQYFVIGDNRGNSHDSRSYDVGPITRADILGKVTRVLIPWRDVE